MTRAEKSWILYDVGNSAFVLIILTTFLPFFYKDYAASGLINSQSTSYWAMTISFSSVFIILTTPFVSAFADFKNLRKPLLVAFTLVGIFITSLFPFVAEGSWLLCLVLFLLSRYIYALASNIYDSFLPHITTKEKLNAVSAYGFAWGYMGSVMPFAFVLLLFYLSDIYSFNEITVLKTGFFTCALWWLCFSLPLIRNIRPRSYVLSETKSIKNVCKIQWHNIKYLKTHKTILLFLLAYFLYIDAQYTIMGLSVPYAKDCGITNEKLLLVIAGIQVLSFPFSLFYGRLSKKYNSINLILSTIFLYCILVVFFFLLPEVQDANNKLYIFWIVCLLISFAQGGMQALSRGVFASLIPVGYESSFFSLFNLFGRYSSIIGSALISLVILIGVESRWGILSLLILFLSGTVLLFKVKLLTNTGNNA